MGLDLGSKTVGVALSDPLKIVASPLKTVLFPEDDYRDALEQVIELALAYDVSKIIVGLPKHLSGDIGERGEISLKFQTWLAEALKIPVLSWDERLTTKQAERILLKGDISRKKRKKVIDKMAAVIILQSYLDTNN